MGCGWLWMYLSLASSAGLMGCFKSSALRGVSRLVAWVREPVEGMHVYVPLAVQLYMCNVRWRGGGGVVWKRLRGREWTGVAAADGCLPRAPAHA